MKSFAIMTMKGGTGKTTTAVSLAHGLTLSGRKVLLVDCDPQRNVAVTFGVKGEKGLDGLLMTGDVDIIQVRENLFIIDSGGRRLVEHRVHQPHLDKVVPRTEGPQLVAAPFQGPLAHRAGVGL